MSSGDFDVRQFRNSGAFPMTSCCASASRSPIVCDGIAFRRLSVA
jgi:hypothetical protein